MGKPPISSITSWFSYKYGGDGGDLLVVAAPTTTECSDVSDDKSVDAEIAAETLRIWRLISCQLCLSRDYFW